MKQLKSFMETASFFKILITIFLAVSGTAWTTSKIMSGYEFSDTWLDSKIVQETIDRKKEDSILLKSVTDNGLSIKKLEGEWNEYKLEQMQILTGIAKDISFISDTIKELKGN